MGKKQRIQSLFADPNLHWIRSRLHARVRQGKELSGKINLSSPSESEVIAFANLTGRPSRSRQQLNLPLELLETILQEAELADTLTEAVFLLEGTVVNERQRREKSEQSWTTLFQKSRSRAKTDPFISEWLKTLERNGLLKRLSSSNLEIAQRLINEAFALYERLPTDQLALPTLAAQITRDSHALDYGKPLAGIIMPLLASLHGIGNWQTPEERRSVWAANGVLCDALSHPVLVCNLRLSPSHPLGPLLESAYELEEPTCLTLRQLSRFPIESKEDCISQTVYICENPAIVAANTEANGKSSHPLICTSGNLTSSAQILLSQLSKSGIRLYYHGDFDWPGLKIANFVFEKFGAHPWRMDHRSYLATTGEKQLTGTPTKSPWDPQLKQAMLEKGTAVYEEQVDETLLEDLRHN